MKTDLSTVEKVSFHGDMIEVARIGDKGYAHLKMMCESLGIDHDTQRRKLRGVKWGGTVIMTAPDERGCLQRLVMIDLDAVPMWLATIHPSKVAFEVRVKLESYQMEAAKVLGAWFRGPADERLARLTALVSESGAEQLKEARHVAEVARAIGNIAIEVADDAIKMLDAIVTPHKPNSVPPMTVRQARDEWRILGSDGRLLPDRVLPFVGKAVAARCRAMREPVVLVDDDKKGTVNAYPVSVLAGWKTDHDLRCRVSSQTYLKFHQQRLFA